MYFHDSEEDDVVDVHKLYTNLNGEDPQGNECGGAALIAYVESIKTVSLVGLMQPE